MGRIDQRNAFFNKAMIQRSQSNRERLQDCINRGKARVWLEFKKDESKNVLNSYYALLTSKKFIKMSKIVEIGKITRKKVLTIVDISRPQQPFIITEEGKCRSTNIRKPATKSISSYPNIKDDNIDFLNLNFGKKKKYSLDQSIMKYLCFSHEKRKAFFN